MKKSKKLTPRQRKKEMTGINLEAINKRFEELDKKIDDTQAWLIALASACWQMCGSGYATMMSDALCKRKKKAGKRK